MRPLDRLVVVVALAVLVGLGLTLAAPASQHALATPTPSPAPVPTVAPLRLVREGIVGTVRSVDPLYATTPAERDISALVACGLTRLGPDDSILPDLASSWDVADAGATYTFRLRSDARWHDGRLVTADDVIFTILAIRDPAYDGPFRGRWDRIVVEKVDRSTVRFRLARPLAGFLPLTIQPLIPEHILGPIPASERRTHRLALMPVGCGPFRLGTPAEEGFEVLRVDGAASPTLRPWDALGTFPEPTPSPADLHRPLVPGFRFTLYAEEPSLERAFADGRLDTAAGLSPAAVARLIALGDAREIRYPTPVLRALMPNLRFDRPTFQDPRVRRALLLAVDRATLLRDLLGGVGTVAESLVTPASPVYDAGAAGRVPFEPDQASRGLVAAGWVPGPTGWLEPGRDTPEPLTLLGVDDPDRPDLRRMGERIVASWRAIGFRAELELLPAAELFERRLRPGAFDLALLDLDLGLDPDLFPLLASSQAQAGGSNLAGYQSAEMDRLLMAARQPADPETRRQRFAALQRLLAQQLPILPIAFAEWSYVVRDVLVGPAPRLVPSGSERWWNVLAWRFAGN
ncbi:MAG: ABC transporter substrate-binding protein [Chloroflexi bacterium]|nr:ABC transporter substrate-binding protein [Chloroflexota bacterium]